MQPLTDHYRYVRNRRVFIENVDYLRDYLLEV